MTIKYGIQDNKTQLLLLLLQVLLVGLTIGMTRTVVPALAESDFGVPKNSFLLLSAFVVAFGLVKGVMNFVAGRLSERVGRKKVLLLGWWVALPIPAMIGFASSWNWIVAATVLLGINQGLTWSMTQTASLDLTLAKERGLTLGLNEFSGYVGVALAGIVTAYLATQLGPRQGILIFGTSVIVLAIFLTLVGVKETLTWAQQAVVQQSSSQNTSSSKHLLGATDETNNANATKASNAASASQPRYPQGVSAQPTTLEIFTLMSWRDKRLMAFCQAGLVEKFVDALVWIFYPIFLYQKGLSLLNVGWVISFYGLVWGGSQLFTGSLSDRFGRHLLNVGGMWLCGAGVLAMVLGQGIAWWISSAAITGLGMAMLYPNLSAAVADISRPTWRGSAIGIYRFWRDLGYGIGAFGLGLVAHLTGQMQSAFWLVALAMFVSGGVLWYFGEETHPLINSEQ